MVNIRRKGLMLVLSSPSGAGKTSISRKLLELDDQIKMSVSATTRKMRTGEVDGKDYYFTEKEKFQDMVNKGEFLECALVFGNYYGTPEKPVYEAIDNGKDVLFDIDWQGTISLQKKCGRKVVSIFILPPSMAELEKRLRARAQDEESVIKERMSKASDEISHWLVYDYILVNENIDQTVERVKHILEAERHKRFRLKGMEGFVGGLLG
ncbi:MAG TPA: guanylate kinase [Alphaproteobacteria bacterium]|nr:guanylate kinase [Alphaproteobacteria bacterium]